MWDVLHERPIARHGRRREDEGREDGGRPQLKENIKGKPRKRGAAHP